jgi:PKD repeat protein
VGDIIMEILRFFRISFLVMFLICLIIGTATAETWEKTFGGSDSDWGSSVQQTTDGGYIIAGDTFSFGKGGSNVYLIKTDASGNELWSKTHGGSDDEMARDVQQTTDGGYIIAGEIFSWTTEEDDVYLIKTDASGKELWSKTFGLGTHDSAYSVQEANDGGYIIVGETYTGESYDVWLIKTDVNGNELWSKTYGGANSDGGRSVQQTTDGGYIIAGHTGSFGAGGWDIYLIKTDGNGNELWHKAFGGGGHDGGEAVQQTTDSGYIIVGSASSFGAGSYDVYLIKTDASGNELWSKTFGGSTWDYGESVQQTTDGGYIICGFTGSFGAGKTDVWLIKTDASGNQIWSKTFGGSEYDRGYSVQQTSDEGYIIAGDTDSFGAGSSDVYLVYLLPGADFTADVTSGTAPLTVGFTDQSIGDIISWQWDFGDGLSSNEQDPSHTYTDPGIYTVSLAVTDPEGSDTEIKNDYISVIAIEPSQGTIGTQVDITNLSNLGEKAPKVLIGESKCKVLTSTTTSVSCLLKKVKKTMGPGTYNVTITPKGKAFKGVPPIVLTNAFSIMGPSIIDINPVSGPPKDQVIITGSFFGTKKVKASMANGIGGKSKKGKVVSLTMDANTGASTLVILVPKKLAPGLYDVTVTNKVGEDTRVGGFTIQ